MAVVTHGMSKTIIYRIWCNMKGRCCNENDSDYAHYGGKGITVCDRWLNSFENFYEDMDDRPEGMSLDRINSNGEYSPENCKWATLDAQKANRRNCVFLKINDEVSNLKYWCTKYDVNYSSAKSRYQRSGS